MAKSIAAKPRTSDLASLAIPERKIPAEVRIGNFQWYLSGARNAVYFAAYSPERLTTETFFRFVSDVMALAPQLNYRLDERRQVNVDARPFSLGEIATLTEVSSFDGFPDRALQPDESLFNHPRLPWYRAECYVLPEGKADEHGNRSFVVCRAAHSLMEGIDAADVLRGRPSDHSAPVVEKRSLWSRFVTGLVGIAVVPFNLLIAAIQWRKVDRNALRTMNFDRQGIKQAAANLGVQQRSLIFALVIYGLYHRAADGSTLSRRRRILGYSNLTAHRVGGDDTHIRLRMQITAAPFSEPFTAYVRDLDKRLTKAGNKSLGLQMHYNTIMGIHRRIARVLPFLYGDRFFKFVPYDFVLSLIPPHHPGGGIFAPLGFNRVYCGSHSPGVNCCVIVPQPDRLTVNIYAPEPLLERASGIGALLTDLGIPERTASARAATRARSAGVA